MINFFEVFDQQIYNQYLVLGVAVLVVIVIKIWMTNKAYQKKLASFIHPDTVLSDLKAKIKSVDQAQSLLAFNILKVVEDGTRLRNIAFLLAYLKNNGIPLKPLSKKISETFNNLQELKLTKSQKSYKQYILNQIEQQKNQIPKKKLKN